MTATTADAHDEQDETLTAALAYATRGWSVLPVWWVEDGTCACPEGARCKAAGKHPIGHMAPNGLNSASRDADTIRQWHAAAPRMNIAVATGAASNLVVLDLDMREVNDEDVDGEFELRAWLAARGIDLPDTLTQSTGGGGKHVLLSLPSAGGVRPVISSRTNWLPGVDIRGDGGYIVVAPSQHVSGEVYSWSNETAIGVITQDLLNALSSSRKIASATGKSMPSLGDGENIDVRKLMANGFRIGGRDDGFVRLVGVLRARGDSLETAKAIVSEVWQKTDQGESDYYTLAAALEKVDRGYSRWDAPEPVSDAELAWAVRADSRAARRHAASGALVSGPVGGGIGPGMDSPGIGKSHDESGSESLSRETNAEPTGPDEPIDEGSWEEDDFQDRDPIASFDIAELMRGGDIEREPPTMLQRTDGRCLIYPGRLHSIYGEPGHGKTWVSLYLVRERLLAGESVVYFDYDEDDGGRSIARRLLELGSQPEEVANLHYFNPQGIGRDGDQWSRMRMTVRRCNPTLVVVDTMAPALVELGLNEKDNAEVGAWYRHARWLLSAASSRPALVIVDHVVKSGEGRGRWARGAGDKLGRLHAAYGVDSTTPFSRDKPGQINLLIAKDRGGEVGREGEVAATVRFNPSNNGAHLAISIDVPAQASLADLAQAHENVKQEAKDRIFRVIAEEPDNRQWTARDLKRAVAMQSAVVDEALDDLSNAGLLMCAITGRTKRYSLPHIANG